MKYPDDLVINHSPELYKNVRAQDPKDELTKHLWNKTLGSCSLHINTATTAQWFSIECQLVLEPILLPNATTARDSK